MISGTSYDAIDAAVADFSLDGETLTMTPLGLTSMEMPAAVRRQIADVLPPNTVSLEAVTRLDAELGRLFGAVAARARDETAGGAADLVASHGQTVFHGVDDGVAYGDIQLGNPAWIAQATGLPVVSDLRNRDIVAGGQGAPLVSILDALLILADAPTRGSLNLGGIANITVTGPDGVLAYDLGPANALIDAAVVEISGGAEGFDIDGRRAARGAVRTDLLERLVAEPYYAAPAPKSTGKELFHRGYLDSLRAGLPEIADDDLVATLTELTAWVVAQACTRHRLTDLVVAGGGARNPVLMQRIRDLVHPCAVRSVDVFGLPAQAKEAYAFALLGYLTVHGLPGTLPGATGAPVGSILGSVTPGPRGWQLPPAGSQAPRRLIVGDIAANLGMPSDQAG
jgi:anhydro-N-acetylmuramic acid kinase